MQGNRKRDAEHRGTVRRQRPVRGGVQVSDRGIFGGPGQIVDWSGVWLYR